ncbi:dehydratase [bacterium]|nr:MAG: dehydratase [bacterium]
MSNADATPLTYRPRGLTYDQLAVGQSFVTAARTVTEADVVGFAGISGDFNPLHTDAVWAGATVFQGRIAHGMLVASIATGLANQLGIFEGTTLALLEQQIVYRGPVRFGDTVRLELTVAEKVAHGKPDRGFVAFATTVRNQADAAVIEGQWRLLMRLAPDQ